MTDFWDGIGLRPTPAQHMPASRHVPDFLYAEDLDYLSSFATNPAEDRSQIRSRIMLEIWSDRKSLKALQATQDEMRVQDALCAMDLRDLTGEQAWRRAA